MSPILSLSSSVLRVRPKLFLITLIVLPVVAVLTLATLLTIGILSGLRAYVAGEGFYSKYQKDAVFYLERFVRDGEPRYFELYQRAIDVPFSDGEARRELERPSPDLERAARDFRAARNATKDVQWLIWLFQRFRNIEPMRQAIQIWTTGDEHILELRRIGEEIHARSTSGLLGSDEKPSWLARIERLNAELIVLENAFSQTIGEGFREAVRSLVFALLVLDGLLLAAGFLAGHRISSGIIGQVRALQQGAADVAGGNLSARVPILSRDELGELAERFNRMTGSIEHAQSETRDALSVLSSTLEATADGILVIDHQGKIVALNRKTLQLWKLSEEQAGADTAIETVLFVAAQLVNPDEALARFREILAAPEGETLDVLEFRDGRIIERYSQPHRIAGRSFGRVFSFRDITERRHAEMDLVRSNQELEHFAYVASHDLQEPLRTVTSFVQLLQHRYEGKLDADADEFIRFAVIGTLRMEALINDLLAYSRVGARAQSLREVNSERVFRQVIQQLDAAIQSAGARVTHEPLPIVFADALQLGLLFQNLLTNAIKFHREESPVVHVSATSNGPEWVFAVRDNGIGIEKGFLDRVFVIFERLHSTDRYPGTGIGLAICKKIVERHGGRIWVESEPGSGSTFFFSLPAASPPTS